MYYLDYAKKVDDRYILNFFADSAEDLKDVPTDKPYITRNGTNYGVPLDTSVVTIVEKGAKVNYVLQNGAYIAGGDVAPVVGTLEATENKTYLAKDANLDGYSQVVVNVQPALQEKSATPTKAQQIVTPEEGYYGLSKVTVAKIPDNYVIPTGVIEIAANGTHDVSGKASATVNVQPKLQEKTATANGEVTPDDTYQGLSKVTVNVQPKLQEKSVTANGDVTPDSGFQGLSKVTVSVPATPTEEKTVELALADGNQVLTPTAGKNFSKVTITKPADLKPENIKKGVTIAGVVGTYEAAAQA